MVLVGEVPWFRVATMLEVPILLAFAAWVFWLRPSSRLHRSLSLLFFLWGARDAFMIFYPWAGIAPLRMATYPIIAISFASLYFAWNFLQDRAGRGEGAPPLVRRLVPWALLAAALAMEAYYFFDHDAFFIHGLLFIIDSLQPLIYALIALVFARETLNLPSGPARESFHLVSLAFALPAAHSSAFFISVAAPILQGFVSILETLVRILAVVILLGLQAFLFFRARAAQDRAARSSAMRNFLVILPALVVGGFVGMIAHLENWGILPPLPVGNYELHVALTAFWTLVMASLIAYSLAQYRLFGVELRLKRGVRYGVLAGVLASLFLIAFLVLPFVLRLGGGSRWIALPLAILPLVAAYRPARRLAYRAADRLMPSVQPTPDYLARRKLDMYLSALEGARLKDTTSPEEEAFLRDLRRRLGFSEKEHRVVEMLLRAQGRFGPRDTSRLSSRFQVIRELGHGSSARALLAHDVVLQRDVVLKQPLATWVLDPAGGVEFLHEARQFARINHPNVVKLLEIRHEENPPVLILEYVSGGTLRERLAQGPLSADAGMKLASELCAALEAVHRVGVVHRDLKPANVLLDADGNAKLTDFGIAQPPQAIDAEATLPLVVPPSGSLAYMSPEQAQGKRVDERSDLYAWAVVVHEALTGRHYLDFRGLSEQHIRRLIESEKPDLSHARIPSPLRHVMEKAFQKDPRRRYATASRLRRDLEHALPHRLARSPRRAARSTARPTAG